MRIPAFWDTSALVPLCVRQSVTPGAIALYRVHDAVVWWATPVEIASALARLVRMKQLDPSDWTQKACRFMVRDSAVGRLTREVSTACGSLRFAGR